MFLPAKISTNFKSSKQLPENYSVLFCFFLCRFKIVTDFDGNFTIKLTAGKPVVISYIGMKTKTVNVKGKSQVDGVLEDDNTTLNDVVVIGYGTARKKDLTGAVSTVKGADLAKVCLDRHCRRMVALPTSSHTRLALAALSS